MLELLSKEHYCYKIYVSWMENSVLPLLLANTLIWITVPIYKQILTLLIWFFKNLNPL